MRAGLAAPAVVNGALARNQRRQEARERLFVHLRIHPDAHAVLSALHSAWTVLGWPDAGDGFGLQRSEPKRAYRAAIDAAADRLGLVAGNGRAARWVRPYLHREVLRLAGRRVTGCSPYRYRQQRLALVLDREQDRAIAGVARNALGEPNSPDDRDAVSAMGRFLGISTRTAGK